MANIQTIGPEVKAGPLNSNFASLNSAKVEKSGDTITGDLVFGVAQDYQRIIRRPSGDVGAFISLDFDGVATAPISITFFRRANTTGNKEFVIFQGDGTNTAAFRVTNGSIDRIAGRSVVVTAYPGNPNGNVAAPPSSICFDTANGVVYRKASGTGNTGWQAMS